MKIFENTRFVAIILFVLTILFYGLTINRYVTFTDNGELAASSILLGISHPTGYPLFTVLGYFWSAIPLPLTKITQMNLLSAVYVSISALFLFFTIKLSLEKFFYVTKTQNIVKSKKSKTTYEIYHLNLPTTNINLIAFVCSITYSTAITIWQQANSYEVYSLQLLLFNIFLYFTIKLYFVFSGQSTKTWYLIAFLWGLMLTNHLIAIWLAPALFWLYFLNSEGRFKIEKVKFSSLLILSIFVAIPLTLYLYLPIRSAMLPEINWGWVHRSFDKFLYHLSGKQYQVWMFSDNSVAAKNLGKFFELLPYQFCFIGLIPFMVGVWYSFKNKALAVYLILVLLFTLLYSMNYDIFDIENYFVTAYATLFIFLALGLGMIFKRYAKVVPVLLIIPLFNLGINYREGNHSDDIVVNEYCRNLLNNIEKNAIVISSQWDYFVGPFIYLQKVEKQRIDIVIFEKELLRRTWYPLQFKLVYPEIYERSSAEFKSYEKILELFESNQPYDPTEIQAKYLDLHKSIIENNWNEKPIYVTLESYLSEPDFFNQYDIVPYGFAMKILPKGSPIQDLKKVKLDLNKIIPIRNKYGGILHKGIIEIIKSQIQNMIIYANRTGQTEAAKSLMILLEKIER